MYYSKFYNYLINNYLISKFVFKNIRSIPKIESINLIIQSEQDAKQNQNINGDLLLQLGGFFFLLYNQYPTFNLNSKNEPVSLKITFRNKRIHEFLTKFLLTTLINDTGNIKWSISPKNIYCSMFRITYKNILNFTEINNIQEYNLIQKVRLKSIMDLKITIQITPNIFKYNNLFILNLLQLYQYPVSLIHKDIRKKNKNRGV